MIPSESSRSTQVHFRCPQSNSLYEIVKVIVYPLLQLPVIRSMGLVLHDLRPARCALATGAHLLSRSLRPLDSACSNLDFNLSRAAWISAETSTERQKVELRCLGHG